jgi:hypothetical protein
MDLESCPFAFSRRQHLWELARKLQPNDTLNQKAWMKVHQKRLLDKGKIEKLILSLRSIESANSEVMEKIRTEAGYFERKCRAYALPEIPPPASLRGLRCYRSRLQDCYRFSSQKIRHVLDRPRGQLDRRPAMLSPQRPLRGLLGGPAGRLTSTSMSPAPRRPAWNAYIIRSMRRREFVTALAAAGADYPTPPLSGKAG